MTHQDLQRLGLKLGRKVAQGGLDPIPRRLSRDLLNPPECMVGFDLWNAFEVSFLNPLGIPQIYIMQARYAATSEFIVESKSFKLFLNGFNNQRFDHLKHFQTTVQTALEKCVGDKVELHFFKPEESPGFTPLPGSSLDDQQIEAIPSSYRADILQKESNNAPFTFHTHLLRTLCPVTHQPDWGSVLITGTGSFAPTSSSLLRYILGFRNHPDFHETCCETIFTDLFRLLEAQELTVVCQYTRRGGLDINPVRSTSVENLPQLGMVWRQ